MPIRFVQVGAASGPDIVLPSAGLRSSAIELMGSGLGSLTRQRFVDVIAELLQSHHARRLQNRIQFIPLAEVEQAWPVHDSTRRTVFTVENEPS